MNEYEKSVEEVVENIDEEVIEDPGSQDIKLSKWGLFKDLACLAADLSATTTMAVLIKSHLPEPINWKQRAAFFIGVPLISGVVGAITRSHLSSDLDDLDPMVDIIRKYMEED